MKSCLAFACSAALVLGAMANTSLATDELKVGDDAPSFELVGSDGKTHKLADYKGKQAIVIAWYPKAFTGGCTKECESFRDNGKAIREYDVAYFTASTDKADVNKKFAESLKVDYPILSDPRANSPRRWASSTPTRRPLAALPSTSAKTARFWPLIKPSSQPLTAATWPPS